MAHLVACWLPGANPADTLRAPSLWVDAVSHREKSDTLSVVYGYRQGIGFTVYVGATVGRTLDADTGSRRRQSEVFAKGAWTFDLL